jgi:hypothetical protein
LLSPHIVKLSSLVPASYTCLLACFFSRFIQRRRFDILLTVYHYVSQQRNQLNTLSRSQSLYCVFMLYMFRASSVHLQEALH